jgi:diguanylate cyclase (GGDEF)-like protein
LFTLLIGAAWLTAWGWKYNATNAVVERELQRSIAVATSLSNVLLPRYGDDFRRASGTPPGDIPRLEFLVPLGEDVTSQMRGQKLARIEIHDARGVVIFSSDNIDVGDDQSGDVGVQKALQGEAHAALILGDAVTTRRPADAGHDLVQASVPARPGTSEKQEAVFDVYADVSQAMADVRQDAHNIWAIANLAGLSVFGVALSILRRAEEAQRRKDVVTGLPDRESAIKAMAEAQRSCGERCRSGWVVVGVQRLRQVSAAYGHIAADELLRQAGTRMHELPGAEAGLFRLGGEAFALLVVERADQSNDEELAERLARQALAQFDAPIECDGHSIVADLAVGIALGRGSEVGPEELMNRAEVSLTEAKRHGSGQWLLYVPGLEEGVRERLQSVGGLREALDRRQFHVYYQPLVDALSRELVGCEALLRWKHPVKGILLPDYFIPLLEETGLIVDVGIFVLKEACRQAVVWRATIDPRLTVSVNLSARQFADPDLLKRIKQVLDETRLPADALIVEVTETFLALEPEYAASVLADLRKFGIAVAIDDFGVGYSSLSSLRRLPVDILKIDRSFVSQAPHDPVDASIAQAIAALAHGLKLTLVAEGVETEAHAEFTRGIGCNKLQGYLFARPLDVAAFEATYRKTQGFMATDALRA